MQTFLGELLSKLLVVFPQVFHRFVHEWTTFAPLFEPDKAITNKDYEEIKDY
jgi:hypothetical protein